MSIELAAARLREACSNLANLKEPDGKPKRCHAHMLRDTFAAESLLSGMRVEEVSTILGHSSVKITERHYMPWVRARQTSLNQCVMKSWIRQGKIKPRVGRDASGRFAAGCHRRVRPVAGQRKLGQSSETWSSRGREGIGGQRTGSPRLRPPPSFRRPLKERRIRYEYDTIGPPRSDHAPVTCPPSVSHLPVNLADEILGWGRFPPFPARRFGPEGAYHKRVNSDASKWITVRFGICG